MPSATDARADDGADFPALAFDYRHFGRSEGGARQLVDIARHVS